MRQSRFNEVQIIGILREQETGAKTADICYRHGISTATHFKWKNRYGMTAAATSYTPNGLNQYATVGGSGSGCGGGAAYSYDAQGNLTADGARSFSYNLANQLTAATTGSGSASIAYDPLGRLQQVGAAGTTRYLYDGAMLVAEYNTSGTMLRRYVPGQGVDETLVWYEGADLSSPHWLHTDQQGSVIAATDACGTRSTSLKSCRSVGQKLCWSKHRRPRSG